MLMAVFALSMRFEAIDLPVVLSGDLVSLLMSTYNTPVNTVTSIKRSSDPGRLEQSNLQLVLQVASLRLSQIITVTTRSVEC